MSTSICQGLQSCLEPGLVEPQVLRLKLAFPNPNLSKWNNYKLEQQKQEEKEENDYNTCEFREDKNNSDEDDMKNGLSFLQVLTAKNDTGTENVYVHPMVKRSASMLSAKSLDMCTESLGSETGSDSAEETSLLSAAEVRKSPIAVQEVRSFKRLNRNGSFPPPLTSVGGSAGFKVRPHREDGRLVLKAVAVASSTSCFHAERADGRLTLKLLKNFPLKTEEEEDKEEEEEEEDEVENELEQDQEDYEEEEEETEETEEANWGDNGGEDMDEAEKIQRPSRCKHGNNNVLTNWDSFLVAT